MNISYFISKRIMNAGKGSFSSTIHSVAVISVALGIATILVSYLILIGFQNTIKEKAYSFSGHLQVSRFTTNNSYEVEPISINRPPFNNVEDYSYIERIQEYALKPGLLSQDNEVSGVIFKGISSNFDQDRFSRYMNEGKFPQFSDSATTTDVVMSQKVADRLGLGLNDEVIIFFIQNPPRFRKLRITGLFETGLEDFDERMLLGDINLVRRLNDWPDSLAGGVEVFVNDLDRLGEAQLRLDSEVGYELYVESAEVKYFQIFDWLTLLDRNVVIFLSIILFVAGFNMISIVLILIMERTQMIGLLKAMGSPDAVIRRVFAFQGMNLVVKGLLLGNLIALGFGFVQDQFKLIKLDPENYYMEFVPIEWDWPLIIGLNLMTAILISLILLIPTVIVGRVNPIKAIRFD